MSYLRAVAPFVVLAFVWGLSFPAISVGLEALPPLLFAAFRYEIAAVLLLGYAVTSTDGWWPDTPSNRSAVLGGGVFLVAGNGFLFVGQQTVPSGVAAILQGLVPIVTTLWGLWLLPDERISLVGAIGIVTGFVGVALVVRPDPSNLLGTDVVGRLLILAQAVSVSLGGVLVDRARPSLPKTALSGWSMALGGLLLHAASLGLGEPFPFSPSPVAVGAVVYLGVFATAIAFFLFFTLLERHGAVETSLIGYAVPVVATVVSVVFLDERITVLSLVGFVVVFLGFVLLKRNALRDLVA